MSPAIRPTTITRTYQSADACGNTATEQIITVDDKTAPGRTCPDDITVSRVPDQNTAAVATSDNCGGSVTVTHIGDAPGGSCPTTITRTYQGADACGNTADCEQIITIDDKTAPGLTCPDDITVSCTTEVPDPNTAAVATSDNCGGSVTVTHIGDAPGGSCPTTITRTYQGADACGNTADCVQIITVDDKTAPGLTCPEYVIVDCADAAPAVDPNKVATSDNCNGLVVVSWIKDDTTGQTCENRYFIARTYQANDACGNTATCVQYIKVYDQTKPSITCPNDTIVSCTKEVPEANPAQVVAGDNCNSPVVVSYIGDAVNDYTCPGKYRITRMYKAFDACGNSKYCFQSIKVQDTIPPSGICPAVITVSCIKEIPCDDKDPKVAQAMQQIKAAYTDKCGGEVSVAYASCDSVKMCSYLPEKGFNYSHTFKFTVSDQCGNTTACSITYAGACFCTYTQGFWGNAMGKANGLTTSQILDTLFKVGGPVFVGDSVNCGFKVTNKQCILGILPGSGPSNPLSKNYVLDCSKKIKNTLVGQLIALQLNIRYNGYFRKINLNDLVLANSCALSPDQVKALGLQPSATVADLILLANNFLSSNCKGKIFPNGFGGSLTAALTALNEYWDECRIDHPCQDSVSNDRGRMIAENQSGSGFESVKIAPNPASSILHVDFYLEAPSPVLLRIFDVEGHLVKIMELDTQAGENSTAIDIASLKSGVYWLSLTNKERVLSRRFVVQTD